MMISYQKKINILVLSWLSIVSLLPCAAIFFFFVGGFLDQPKARGEWYIYPVILTVAIFFINYILFRILKFEIIEYFFNLIKSSSNAKNYEFFLPRSINQILPAVVFHIDSLEKEKYRLSNEIERQKNEHRSILDLQAEIIFIISEDGFISYKNNSFKVCFEDFGAQADAVSLGESSEKISSLMHELEAFLDAARITETEQECTTSIFFDEKKHFVRWKIKPMEEYRPKKFLLVGRDETENMIIREKNQRLERIALIGKAASAIFHEVNQPMSVMLISASLIEEACGQDISETATGEIRVNTEIIIDQIERTNQIIRNLRLLHSPEHQKIQTELLNPNQIVYRVHQYLAQELSDNNIDFNYSTESPNATIDGNAVLFSQVIVNIVQNSIYSLAADADNTSRQISVFSETIDNRFVMGITDNGKGIPEADLIKVMEPFFTTKPFDIGSGIGLSLCLDIITKMEGDLRISNVKPRGLKTEIVVPLPANTA